MIVMIMAANVHALIPAILSTEIFLSLKLGSPGSGLEVSVHIEVV